MRPSTATRPRAAPTQRRRVALWGALFVLLAVAQTLLVTLTLKYEGTRAQDRADAIAAGVSAELKHRMTETARRLQAFANQRPGAAAWHEGAHAALLGPHELLRLERRDLRMNVEDALDSPFREPLFARYPREQLEGETEAACIAARRSREWSYSRSYFVPAGNGVGGEVVDVCIPSVDDREVTGFVIGTLSLQLLLDAVESPALARDYEISFVEGDGERLARNGPSRGSGVFVSDRLVDPQGHALQLHVDSVAGAPHLIPNLATALVLGLSLMLFVLVIVLARDVRKRSRAESALAEALAMRHAMENSGGTGLKVCDLDGLVRYVNPAFCRLVGHDADALVGRDESRYWPACDGGPRRPRGAAGFESSFVRRDGSTVTVMQYESPLLDGSGVQTGWMCTVLDVTAQRRVEETSRRQQEQLQATARLATMGEMASLLSHELNQPLTAIASYASGSINLLAEVAQDPESLELLRQATRGIAEQAERAGRIIKSVHDFVRRREQTRETVPVDRLIDSVLPLVRLQARRSGTRIEVDLPDGPVSVACDRTMIEQVLLNLTRNGIQAMEAGDASGAHEAPTLTLRVRRTPPGRVALSVIDRGPGIADDVVPRLFTPFFTTRADGMGLGLSLCRTVVEQHGGALEFENLHAAAAGPSSGPTRVVGAVFRFTLQAAGRVEAIGAPAHERTAS